MAFGKYLRTQRTDRKMSQRVLAELIDVSNTEISRIESGERQKPSPVLLRKISEVMNIPLEELMHEAGYTPQTDPREVVMQEEKKFIEIINPFLNKNNWEASYDTSAYSTDIIKFSWDCLATNSTGSKWAIEYIHSKFNRPLQMQIRRLTDRIGYAIFDGSLSKFSIAVSKPELFEVFSKLKPFHTSLDISVILLDFEEGRFVQEIFLS